jgi:hypothetical protein
VSRHIGDFTLHAVIVVAAGERERLERLCRYTYALGEYLTKLTAPLSRRR